MSDSFIESGLAEKSLKTRNVTKYVVRTLLVLVVVGFAIAVPSFSGVINIIGSFTGAFLCFFFPPVLYLKIASPFMSTFEKVVNYFLAIIGFVVWIFCTVISILDLIDG